MQGKIVKGIAGFYYVHVAESGIYECKAKGAFRNQKVKPLVGDNVRLEVLDEEQKKGNIEEILPRKNELIRPAVANIDQALVIFAAAKPKPNFNLLDRFLILMQYQKVPAVVCFNKQDMVDAEELQLLKNTYESFRWLAADVLEYAGGAGDTMLDGGGKILTMSRHFQKETTAGAASTSTWVMPLTCRTARSAFLLSPKQIRQSFRSMTAPTRSS